MRSSLAVIACLLSGVAVVVTLAGFASASSQPVDDDDLEVTQDGEGDDQLVTETSIEGADVDGPQRCAGDGTAVDTVGEVAEFEDYASDEFYVLDDDNDCLDDESTTTGYALPGDGPVRSPAILPLVAAGTGPQSDEPVHMARRSLGGRAVRDAEVPWQVQIYQPWTEAQLAQWGMTTGGKSLWEFQHLCGATLVADNWALTASHCLPESAGRTGYRVRLGAETIHHGGGYTYRIDRVVPYNRNAQPTANGIWRADDISLIHFVDDTGIGRPPASQARALPIDRGPDMPANAAVYATGWGRVSNRANVPTSTMMKVQMNIIANDECARGPWGPSFVHGSVICAAAAGRQTCQGDSGGPLVNRDGPARLVGIVSWNNADCIGDAGRQGIYTRVARYAGWIDRTIKSDRR